MLCRSFCDGPKEKKILFMRPVALVLPCRFSTMAHKSNPWKKSTAKLSFARHPAWRQPLARVLSRNVAEERQAELEIATAPTVVALSSKVVARCGVFLHKVSHSTS